MRTFEPLGIPSHTHPKADGRLVSRTESESIHDFGSTSLAPHIFLRLCSNSWNRSLLGSEIPQRAYASVERGARRSRLRTHTIQILNDPDQITALQSWNNVLILVSAKEVDELLVKLWRCFVEVTKFLQGVG